MVVAIPIGIATISILPRIGKNRYFAPYFVLQCVFLAFKILEISRIMCYTL